MFILGLISKMLYFHLKNYLQIPFSMDLILYFIQCILAYSQNVFLHFSEMSVANDEEPEALILPSWQSSPRPFQSLPCEPQVPSPAPTDSSEQSTQESSPTLTETETADRPISEGEVLFSCDQMLAARGN